MDEIPGLDASMLTFGSRLATFTTEHQVAKRRASSQKKKQPSNVSWPHESPSDEELARAGFFYKPVADSNDNVQCFHCAVKLDGWESEDVPLQEHLAHSSQCAWALSLSVSDPAEERDPMSADLVEARRSTFANLWPHEKKKGWKCKTNKMVEAGWVYDPSPHDEDGATCFYCNMSLDGWEPKDSPLEEHRRRMPECPFFGLVERYKGTRKGGRGRASTASKASRLSTQSMQSTFSEAPSLMSLGDAAPDATIDESLQIDTTISSDAGKGRKKTTKGRKKNARQPSEEPSLMDPIHGTNPEPEAEPESAPAEEKPKVTRGRKAKTVQDSTIVDDSSMAEPVKKTKGRTKTKQPSPARISQDESQLQSELQDAAELAPASQSPPSKSGRGVKRTSDGLEKTSLTEDTTVDEVPAKPKRAVKGTRGKKGKKAAQEDSEMAIEEPAEQDLKPKRGRSKKAQKPESEPEPEQEQEQIHEFEPDVEQVIEPEAIQSLALEEDVEVEAEAEIVQDFDPEHDVQEELDQGVESESEVENQIQDDIEAEPEEEDEEDQVRSPSVHEDVGMQDEEAGLEAERPEEAATLAPTPAAEEFEPTPTPQSVRGSVVRRHTQEQASESTHSTPQSNHSSDAENHPPSSSNHAPTTVKKATASAPQMDAENSAFKPKEIFASPSKTVRVPLATSTPNHSPSRRSPSKFGHLTSSTPWEPIDIDAIFFPASENENVDGDDVFSKLLEVGGALTSPEKKMSVEEWIRSRAELGETKLKSECERMVMLFEKEGNRGLQALSGVRTL